MLKSSLTKLLVLLFIALPFASSTTFADELKDISKMAEGGQQVAALERINTYLVTNPKDVQVMFMKSGQITSAVFKQASRKCLSKLKM